MMMSEVPADLVEEILSRVPATSLKRFRSTCKRWNCLFKEPGFTEKHFRKAPKQSRVLVLKENRVFSMSINLNVVPPSIEFKDELSLKDSHSNSEPVDIAIAFHCDGLLLCITDDDRHRPVVWNPCSGETRWIQHENGYKRDSSFALGYRNNKYGRNYKILMNWEGCEKEDTVGGFEIYEFSSNSWRAVNPPNRVSIGYRSVNLKGNTYWNFCNESYLHSFDFTREIFGRLSLPSAHDGGYRALSVVRDEKLSVIHYNLDTSKIEVWLTNKLDNIADLSWIKSFTVDLHSSRVPPLTILLMDEEKKVALCFNPCCVYTIGEDGRYYKEIPYMKEPYFLGLTSWWPFIFNYVPSLVQIQSN